MVSLLSSKKPSRQTSRGQGDQAQTHQKGAIRFACIQIYLEYNIKVDFSKHWKWSCLKEFQSNIQLHLWHAFVCFSLFSWVNDRLWPNYRLEKYYVSTSMWRSHALRTMTAVLTSHGPNSPPQTRYNYSTKTKASHLHLHNLGMQPHTQLCLYKDLKLFIYHLTWVLKIINSLKRHCFLLNFSLIALYLLYT